MQSYGMGLVLLRQRGPKMLRYDLEKGSGNEPSMGD